MSRVSRLFRFLYRLLPQSLCASSLLALSLSTSLSWMIFVSGSLSLSIPFFSCSFPFPFSILSLSLSLSPPPLLPLCHLICSWLRFACYPAASERLTPAPSIQPISSGSQCQVFCSGALLHSVQMAGLFNDSKDFVDMPMRQTYVYDVKPNTGGSRV